MDTIITNNVNLSTVIQKLLNVTILIPMLCSAPLYRSASLYSYVFISTFYAVSLSLYMPRQNLVMMTFD